MSTQSPAVVPIRVIGVLAVVLAVLTAAVGVASSFARASAQDSFTVPAVRVVEVSIDAGQITVEPTDGDRVEVDVTSVGTWSEPRTDRAQAGDRLRLSARCGTQVGFGRCRVDYRIAVPDGVDVDLRTVAGRISVDGIDGDVRARGDAVDARLTDLRSQRVDVTTEVGRVLATFDEVPQDVRATASTGAVDITLPADGEPYAVQAVSDVGNAVVDVATDPSSPRTVEARTSVGSVTVTSR